ncbi:MAG: hypothetical protein JXB39_14650 [Deltaproteobacteria bacterium]|nr:hypothetical protein [Deltaproteobacteria bacterium]
MRAVPWIVVGLLALSSAGHAWVLLAQERRFAVMPIFVPVSLEHERALREARGQPAGRGGEEAVDLARALEHARLDPEVAAAVAPRLDALRRDREALLGLRNERHRLNVTLMDVGVAVARELSPEQWDAVHMGRDAARAPADRDLFGRVLDRLR